MVKMKFEYSCDQSPLLRFEIILNISQYWQIQTEKFKLKVKLILISFKVKYILRLLVFIGTYIIIFAFKLYIFATQN